ncbi:MAG: Nif3-like dinuclear metal center hexameric protein [Actinomycetales bacterium]|nr:Nif3-like dinuclear metal center hexameric protein [Actinomycetales bacterium]
MTTTASHPTLAEVISVLEQMYDPFWARDWDAVGLVCGDPQAPVRRVLMAVDPAPTVVEEALAWHADLVLTHHPLLFRAVHGVPTSTPKGRIVHQLIRANCALYTAHTNADVAAPGVSDALARVLGLTDLVPLSPDPTEPLDRIVAFARSEIVGNVVDAVVTAGATTAGPFRGGADGDGGAGRERRVEVVSPRAARSGVVAALQSVDPEISHEVYELATSSSPRGIGRIGRLSAPTTLREFAMLVAEALPSTTQGVRVAGDPTAEVSRVAVCGGAGDSLLDTVRTSGADVYVTADLRHHPAFDLREHGGDGPPYLVDVAHWASEWPWLAGAANRLAGAMEVAGSPIEVLVSVKCTDPWTFRVPSPGGVVR